MLDIKFIRENADLVKKSAKNKGYDIDIKALLKLDIERVKLIEKRDTLRSGLKLGKKPEKNEIENAKKTKLELKKIEDKFNKVEEAWTELMLLVPSVHSDKSPIGKEDKNIILRKSGSLPKFSFKHLDHVELGENLNLIDIERGVKIGGTRSYILKNQLVIIEQALLRLALDKVTKEGFQPMNVPILVNHKTLIGSGFFPFGEDDVYKVDEDSYLVGTSEASLVCYYSGETLMDGEMPKLLSGITTCFRREVGTYGKDNRGIFRVHQFNKVEQVVLCKKDNWEKMFNFILGISESIVKDLELPYQVVEIATGDLGAKNVQQQDIEVWFPSQNKYRETHSCSYLADFQSRRANIKWRDENGNKEFVHTLNNTGVATPRILAACLENWQQKDGSIKIPKALHKYTGFKEIR